MNLTKLPQGATNTKIPFAKKASDKTSKEIVSDLDKDAYFFRSLEHKGIELNESQIKAVRHYKGPLLTLSGAGVGKTTLLTCRASYLMSYHQVPPENMLLVTFTKKAADEMKERIISLTGTVGKNISKIEASTFHAFFLKLLRKQGYHQEIVKEEYKRILIKQLLKEAGLKDEYQAENVLSLISGYKIRGIKPNQVIAKTTSEKEIQQIYKQYEQWKKKHERIDFDDMLQMAFDLLKNSPELLKLLQNRFQFVLVDEFQDTNFLQYELIKLITEKHKNLTVVGDPDQTIYSFNGAKYEFIMNFDKTFPNTKVISLDINYRSKPSIVGLGNEIIKLNHYRKAKTLTAKKEGIEIPSYLRPNHTDDEAEQVVKHIQAKINDGTNYGDIAVLYRTSSSGRAIFELMTMSEIPFTVSRQSEVFYEQKMVKPMIDHLRLCLNHRDFTAIEGVLGSLYIRKDLGMRHIEEKEQHQKKKYPMIHLKSYPHLQDFQKAKVVERIKLIKAIAELKPEDAIKRLRTEFYDKYIEADERQELTSHKEMNREMLDEVESSAKRFENIKEFVYFINNMIKKHQELKTKRVNESGAVSLMTIHAAKGLEFPVVYIVGFSEGILPHSSSIDPELSDQLYGEDKDKQQEEALEEERRLAYVAVTRAKEELMISSPQFYRGARTDISRFIKDVFQSNESHSSKQLSNTTKKLSNIEKSKQEEVTAWLCTNTTCNGWIRISPKDSVQEESRECPICSTSMNKGKKVIKNSF
ncbi:UvrD-helicase domain-containing protein [Chengkuizengella axinellae]|uniref:DNA 3'-5' helicase n=1 Tax=Chengkuizengella axinellae TaxID=3064388 RepID=A0ABT9IV73_9BACL|nr:UvrD-helicase domain-containing protein [Chengkuizengella sp. 2205SS18-9]MDP5273264.1 UvrD-helicase domain-containing protein [Chengkuizengella sp. 2205SS18-9]